MSREDMMPKQQSLRSFTEAVPLSLSSMAHMSLPLEDGVSDGMRQVLQHTLMACVQYARALYAPHDWTVRDLVTSSNAWRAVYGGSISPAELPQSLSKLGLKHQYARHCLVYLGKDGTALPLNHQVELESLSDWTKSPNNSILARISLLYASKEMLTAEEMEIPSDTESDISDDDDDVPSTVLFKVLVEYRSLPPSGKVQAVEAEELSMLSFGGSVDDDVKYGALASLYDDTARYVLEIYSVRGKKYKFDLMDSTLSNGTVPRWKNEMHESPFTKSLCVTVTDHGPPSVGGAQSVTKMHLTLEGPLRKPMENLPPFAKYPTELVDTFFILDPNRKSDQTATGMPSRQSLLLDPRHAGKVFLNGRLITSWGHDPTVGTHVPALFGLDMHGVPVWHGRIVDYEVFKKEYARLWQEIMIDARLEHLKIANKLLYRLIHGKDDDDEYYDEEDGNSESLVDCLESQIMSSAKYDPVGICAKALATHFAAEYGKKAYPCEAHEVDWVQTRLGGKTPVVVPPRLISILRRGGYFDVKATIEYEWESEYRLATDNTATPEHALVLDAIALLEESGCTDVSPAQLCFVDKKALPSNAKDCIVDKCICRYDDSTRRYFINDAIVTMELPRNEADGMDSADEDSRAVPRKRAFLLGMYIAQEHPDGTVLVRYLLRHSGDQLLSRPEEDN